MATAISVEILVEEGGDVFSYYSENIAELVVHETMGGLIHTDRVRTVITLEDGELYSKMLVGEVVEDGEDEDDESDDDD